MAISKKTVNEMLETYLREKGLSESNISEIEGNLHRGVVARKEIQDVEVKERKQLVRRKEKAEKKMSTSHGTSCPRLMDDFDGCQIEM